MRLQGWLRWIPIGLWMGCVGTEAIDLSSWIPRMKVDRAQGGSVQELSRDRRVVVVMTTIPPRINRLEPVIDSMLRQTWPVEAVYLSIPDVYNRTGEAYVIPDWLQNKRGLQIARCTDLGPGTHLLNGLRLEQDPWTYMAVVDDDHIYAPDLVENLMRSALAYPGSAVAAQGFLSVPGLKIEKDSPRYLHDQGFAAGPVLVSYLGVVYQRGFFDNGVLDYSSVSKQCMYQDDMWFSAHLAQKGIKRVVLGAALGVEELKDVHLGPSSLTFWEDNRPRKVSEDCNDSLLRRRADIWAHRRRLVLALAGLPSFDAALPEQGGVMSDPLAQPEWQHVLAILRNLPVDFDLVYLCTSTKGLRVAYREHAKPKAEVLLGRTFHLDGQLAAASGGCEAYAVEAKVGQMLTSPLAYEGDPSTVVVVGTLQAIAARPDDIAPVATCAALVNNGGDPEAVVASRTEPHGGNVAEPSPPFCRLGELAAVSIGALGGR